MLGENTKPGYSILQYFIVPELSSLIGVVPPPYCVFAVAVIPSILFTPPLRLKPALPKSMIPPQSPAALCPADFPEVNTIGSEAVPMAFNLAPLVMIKAVPVLV